VNLQRKTNNGREWNKSIRLRWSEGGRGEGGGEGEGLKIKRKLPGVGGGGLYKKIKKKVPKRKYMNVKEAYFHKVEH